jgi:hypothetical protein
MLHAIMVTRSGSGKVEQMVVDASKLARRCGYRTKETGDSPVPNYQLAYLDDGRFAGNLEPKNRVWDEEGRVRSGD